MIRSLLSRWLSDEEPGIDLMELAPFQVAIDLSSSIPLEVNDYELNVLVKNWMTDSFETSLEDLGLASSVSEFRDILLTPQSRLRRFLQNEIYTVQYKATSIWVGVEGRPKVQTEMVDLLQRTAMLQDDVLEQVLRAADTNATGLGLRVQDVEVELAPETAPPTISDNSSNRDSLEIIIVVAIIVACLAFLLLLFAVIWAWKSEQQRPAEPETPTKPRYSMSPDGTGSESEGASGGSAENRKSAAAAIALQLPPKEVVDKGVYPESVISEDISTSLSAYYRSGMSAYPNGNKVTLANASSQLNDAASMSSMESYGYSLDGYAPSMSGGSRLNGH